MEQVLHVPGESYNSLNTNRGYGVSEEGEEGLGIKVSFTQSSTFGTVSDQSGSSLVQQTSPSSSIQPVFGAVYWRSDIWQRRQQKRNLSYSSPNWSVSRTPRKVRNPQNSSQRCGASQPVASLVPHELPEASHGFSEESTTNHPLQTRACHSRPASFASSLSEDYQFCARYLRSWLTSSGGTPSLRQ